MRKITIFVVTVAVAAAMAYGCSKSSTPATEEEVLFDIGEACTLGSECKSNWCSGGICADLPQIGDVCTADADCYNAVCVEGICTKEEGNGDDIEGVPEELNNARAELDNFINTTIKPCVDQMEGPGNKTCGCADVNIPDESSGKITLNNCVSTGLTFNGSLDMTFEEGEEGPSTIKGTMTTFGECSDIQIDVMGECQGTIKGSCASQPIDCILSVGADNACVCGQ